MEQSSKSLVEKRAEFVLPPYGEANPIKKMAHFLQPSVRSSEEPIFDIPTYTLSFVPLTFESETWPLSVSFMGWRYPQRKWKEWVEKMASLHESTWKKAGIREAILNSTYEIRRNNDLVFGVAERWCPETKSFIFPWGEATITLEDMLAAGYSVLGSPVFAPLETEELKEIEQKLETERLEMTRTSAKKASNLSWMKKFMDSGSEIEHEAFLVLWLSRYIFPGTFDSIRKVVFAISIHLARGTRIALAPAVLASIYRDMTLLKGKIGESTLLGTEKGKHDDDVLKVKLWSPMQLVQVWAWERFKELQPKPKLMKSGYSRLARWDKLKQTVENVSLALDSGKWSFIWRPYSLAVENWDFPNFYREKEMWVTVGSSLNEDLMAFARCIRASMLCGLDCSEEYLPHRVAMQFGIDQDLPGRVGQCCENAWADYSRTLDGVKLFVPSRLFEAEVTFRYKEWWNKSMEGLKGFETIAEVRKPRDEAVELVEPSTTSVGKDVQREDGGIQPGGHVNAVNKNLEPVTALVEKVKHGEVVMGGSDQRVVEDATQTTPSLACEPLSSKDNREGSEVPCEELEANILELELMIARIKTARLKLELSP